MTQILATIKGVQVFQEDDGRVHWTSGAAVDADGANGQEGGPFAYRADNLGLDSNANAGYPNGSWRDVLIDNGNGEPRDDGSGNWFSQTAYCWSARPVSTRYVNSMEVPYVVVNPKVRVKAVGIVVGCKARVTYNEKSVIAVVADVSGPGDIGELSIAAARVLGIPESPRTGGVGSGVQFELWTGTKVTIDGTTYELQPA